ncbi:hypothetical protein AX16_007050 [Volvariella volvacea WC 439]|nr:hypothetical protein AX16_007050 [Volvariella volvacea WC 439]
MHSLLKLVERRTLPRLARFSSLGTAHRLDHDLRQRPRWVVTEEDIGGYKPGGYRPTTVGEHLSSGQYEILRKLGHGQQSTIWLARNRESSKDTCVTLKIFASELSGGAASAEVAAFERLRERDPHHPGCAHVPSLLDTFWSESRYGRHLCVVIELLGVDVHNIANSYFLLHKHVIPEFVAKRVMRDILLALDYCHTKCHLVHTDIKLSNVLTSFDYQLTHSDPLLDAPFQTYQAQAPDGTPITITERGGFLDTPEKALDEEGWKKVRFILADFGSVHLAPGNVLEHYAEHLISSPASRPPEVFMQVPWNATCDIWSAGMVLFQLLALQTLFPSNVPEELFPLCLYMVLGRLPDSVIAKSPIAGGYFNRSDGTPHPEFGVGSAHISLREEFAVLPTQFRPSEAAIDFLLRMLVLDPAERPTPRQLLDDPWLSDVV